MGKPPERLRFKQKHMVFFDFYQHRTRKRSRWPTTKPYIRIPLIFYVPLFWESLISKIEPRIIFPFTAFHRHMRRRNRRKKNDASDSEGTQQLRVFCNPQGWDLGWSCRLYYVGYMFCLLCFVLFWFVSLHGCLVASGRSQSSGGHLEAGERRGNADVLESWRRKRCFGAQKNQEP